MSGQTSPEQLPLSFFWWYTSSREASQPAGQTLTLRACSTVTFLTGANPNSTVTPTPPYTLLVFPSSGIPQSILAGQDGSDAAWRVNYPVGTQLLLSLVDSQGLSGGTSAPTTVIGGSSNNCAPPTSQSTLSLDYTPAVPNTCQSVTMLPSGGRPPYVVSIQKAADQGINITSVTNTTTWTNDLQAGGAVIFALSDSAGQYAETSPMIFSAGGTNTSCFTNRKDDGHTPGERPSGIPSHKSTSSKGLVGGVVAASLISAILLASIAFLFWRRRKQSAGDANKRLSFTNAPQQNYRQTGTASSLGFSPVEKFPPRLHSPIVDVASVHSLQNLHPYKFRVVNPDLDLDNSRVDDDVPASPSINSHHGSPDLEEPRAQTSAYSHTRSTSGGFTNRRRSNSIKSSPSIGSDKRRSGGFQPISELEYGRRRDSLHSLEDLPDHSAYSGYT